MGEPDLESIISSASNDRGKSLAGRLSDARGKPMSIAVGPWVKMRRCWPGPPTVCFSSIADVLLHCRELRVTSLSRRQLTRRTLGSEARNKTLPSPIYFAEAKFKSVNRTGDTRMFTKTKIALAAALILGTASAGLANDSGENHQDNDRGTVVGVNHLTSGNSASAAGVYGYAAPSIHKHRPVREQTQSQYRRPLWSTRRNSAASYDYAGRGEFSPSNYNFARQVYGWDGGLYPFNIGPDGRPTPLTSDGKCWMPSQWGPPEWAPCP
jgi:hypothetical protein